MELNTSEIDGGKKYDQGKLRTDLYPFTALIGVCDILGRGAKKYGDRNWEKGLAWSRCFGAVLRHLLLWWYNIQPDAEWGKDHIHHAATELAFLQHFCITRTGNDDRPQLSPEVKEEIKKLFEEEKKKG